MTSKFFRNPNRGKEKPFVPYTPQYKIKGIEPTRLGENAFGIKGQALVVDRPETKSFSKMPKPTNIPYAEIAPPPSKTFRVPNVGNNIEASWSGFGEEVVDDLDIMEINENDQMIDNNEYYTDEALSAPQTELTSGIVEELKQGSDVLGADSIDLSEGEYLLAIEGTVISVGSLEFIQNEVRDLVFGDHKLCAGKAIPVEDIVVLKRMSIRMGVFVNE